MRKVKWGVLGTAGIAEQCTIPGMQKAENCELYGIAGRNFEKAKLFAEKFGFQKAYGSYEELLSDPQIEAVYIPLPNTLHVEWTKKALEAKKHVLCEKPLAPTAAEAELLIKTAEKNGMLLMEAFAYLHSPLMREVKEKLDRGVIGEVLYMESAFITSDYNPNNIRMRKETCGGCTYDLGCYTISQILWMLGEEPDKVQAVADFSEEGIDVYTSGLLTFRDGKKAAFSCGMVLPTDQDKRIDRFQIHGTKGYFWSEAEFNQCGEVKYTVCVDGKKEVYKVFAPHNYQLEIEQFSRCIIAGETPYVSNDFTFAYEKVIEKVLERIGY